MKWKVNQFHANVISEWRRYKDDNSWFTNWGDPKEAIINAWKLYKAANENALGFLILGDAKIRTSGDLLANFGLASGSGVNDDELGQLVELQSRAERLMGDRLGNPPVDVCGPGSILNDRTWTPLLNDAFILGGVHAGQDFQWAEVESYLELLDRQEFFQRSPSATVAAYNQEKWKLYILKHSNFWSSDGVPRVFAREVIGLKTFGYSPVFTDYNVYFKCKAPSNDATFKAYLDELANVNFKASGPAINAALGKFLFNDSNALTTLGAMTKSA